MGLWFLPGQNGRLGTADLVDSWLTFPPKKVGPVYVR